MCTFERLPFAVEVKYIGNAVANSHQGSVEECIETCEKIENCKNFVYARHKKECYLKDGLLNGSEPLRSWNQQFSVYKSCKTGT